MLCSCCDKRANCRAWSCKLHDSHTPILKLAPFMLAANTGEHHFWLSRFNLPPKDLARPRNMLIPELVLDWRGEREKQLRKALCKLLTKSETPQAAIFRIQSFDHPTLAYCVKNMLICFDVFQFCKFSMESKLNTLGAVAIRYSRPRTNFFRRRNASISP